MRFPWREDPPTFVGPGVNVTDGGTIRCGSNCLALLAVSKTIAKETSQILRKPEYIIPVTNPFLYTLRCRVLFDVSQVINLLEVAHTHEFLPNATGKPSYDIETSDEDLDASGATGHAAVGANSSIKVISSAKPDEVLGGHLPYEDALDNLLPYLFNELEEFGIAENSEIILQGPISDDFLRRKERMMEERQVWMKITVLHEMECTESGSE